MLQFKDHVLLERVFGNTGWVYHRTPDNPSKYDIVKYGIKASSNESAMYGRGLYTCYDLDQQMKPNMTRYGSYILKGKIDLNGFAILDSDVYWLANPKGNFQKHLEQIGTNMESVKDESPYTSEIAKNIWKKCKQKGYNGIVFTGRSDGKVAVIWNRRNFIPFQYTEDEGKNWAKLTPDIASIKRPHDPEYDKDDEKINFSKLLKEISDKEELEKLIVPPDYKGIVFLKKLKKIGNIIIYNETEINLPNLQKCGNIIASYVQKINLPNLQECGLIDAGNATEINLPNLQISSNIYATIIDKINLPNLKYCSSIYLDNATEVNLPNFNTGRIVAPSAEKIIIPKESSWFSKEVPEYCEIIHPEEQEIKVNEDVTFKKYLMLKESLVQIPLDSAYEIFKNEYDKSTGTSWTYDKFMGRARNWEFYGDEKGYVAIRRQRSGLVKLVGMAGDNRSKLKGINDLISMKMPLWGMVSKDIKDIAVRRGMREPNFLERQVLKRSIPPEVLGGAEILEYQKDGGIKLQYPDVGVVVKYLVGTPEYYAKLRTMLGDKVKEKILG